MQYEATFRTSSLGMVSEHRATSALAAARFVYEYADIFVAAARLAKENQWIHFYFGAPCHEPRFAAVAGTWIHRSEIPGRSFYLPQWCADRRLACGRS